MVRFAPTLLPVGRGGEGVRRSPRTAQQIDVDGPWHSKGCKINVEHVAIVERSPSPPCWIAQLLCESSLSLDVERVVDVVLGFYKCKLTLCTRSQSIAQRQSP